MKIYSAVKNDTLIHECGVLANINAVEHITEKNVPGCIIECGVYKGGSVAAMLYKLIELGDTSRDIYLFDTYTGMSEPSDVDRKINGIPAINRYSNSKKSDIVDWCYGSLKHVKQVIKKTQYPKDKIHYVVGKVEDTLPFDTGEIAILRLDTDFYESTKAEMEHLYHKVVKGGVVILDDYGVWEGARKAVDEYFDGNSPKMTTIDRAKRMFVK